MKTVVALLCLVISAGLTQSAKAEEPMSLDAMKTLSKQVVGMWAGDATVDQSLFTPDFKNHQEPLAEGGVKALDLSAWVALVEGNHKIFPDLAVTILSQVAEGDQVSTHWRFTGTQEGTYEGLAPTGKTVTWTGVSIHRFVDNKVAEAWVVWDKYYLFEQLGLIEGN